MEVGDRAHDFAATRYFGERFRRWLINGYMESGGSFGSSPLSDLLIYLLTRFCSRKDRLHTLNDGVGDLIAELVRMTISDVFGSAGDAGSHIMTPS